MTRFGQGPRQALAIHCTLAHSGAWRGVAGALSDRLAITAFDLPGHGRSGDWDGGLDLHDIATGMGLDLLDERMDLVGHSFGATVALRLAVTCPGRVRSLTMIEPVFFAAAIADAPERLAAYEAQAADFRAALEAGDDMLAARLFNRLWGDGTPWTDLPESLRDYMAARMGVIAGEVPVLYEDAAGLMKPGVLARATMPSLLIAGETSIDVVDAINAALARRLPDVRRVTIPGAGHMAPITHPQDVAAAISDLLEVS
ncbi:alpha/beta hydrolase [Sulfitobacter sp. D35]|uniref:alpha/beta fold hydrolase n=1 Tax=Sulfitobacter sp. D35 TaxID=3083252 RepID=UPI00296E9F86|nr:alpha/beta hydrolase [Sulfitobacter sp. D35]MDW4497116.1 alpha/beta hydrolase [Sulfitobacter sp. D35]